jgi:signal transduction histidine kinase
VISWILNRNWLPVVLFAGMITLFSAGFELVNSNFLGLLFSASLLATIFTIRHATWLSIPLLAVSISLLILFSSLPLISCVFIAVSLALIAAFGSRRVRLTNLVAAPVFATAIAWYFGYDRLLVSDLVSGSTVSELVRVNSFLLLLGLVLSLFGLAVFSGRLAYLRTEHIGTPKDRAVQLVSGERLRLEIAKQNERLEIAKDLSELLVQKVSAVVSVTEGGRYALASDPHVADRVLERAQAAAREAQGELRRLFDYLNSSAFSELATFKIADLQELTVAYRELGYNTVLEEQGSAFALNAGMELCVYKIVFESLENVRKHTPVGTEISISFLWVEDGLQVLIKDNGFETVNRERQALGELVEGYSVSDDLDALVLEFDGATLSGLKDRAAIYGGRIEATKVPGVGFTLSAIFPNLKSLATESK